MTTPYHYTESGLDNAYLLDGFEMHQTPYGAGVSIHDVDGLHRAIAADLIARRRALTGKEIRFLRKELDLSQEALARLLGCTAQSVARWEKGETEASGSADRLIRLLWQERMTGSTEVERLLTALADAEAGAIDRRLYRDEGGVWQAAA